MPAAAAWVAVNVFAASAATAATVATVTTVAMYALAAGSAVYSYSQGKKQEKAARRAMLANQGMTVTTRDPASLRRIIYGEMRVGGTYVLMHTREQPGGPKNEYLYLIITLAGHEVDSIGAIQFDDEVVPLDGAGFVSSGKYANLARVKKFTGSPTQTADADLVAECPDVWTNDHRLRGIAYLSVRLKYDAKIFSGLPNITAVVRGKKVFDPRNGTTVWTDNAALCLRDYLTDTDYGLGCAADEINDATFVAKANLCDELVTIVGGGTERRYTANGAIERSMPPQEVIETLTGCMAGSLVYTGGVWSLAGGAYESPAATYGWDDLRGEVSIQTADSRRDTCNGVKGTYISPLNQYQPADYPPAKNATYLTQDGERVWRELDLPMTASPATAQRLAKIELERARQEITVKLPLKLQGLRVQVGDTVLLNLDRYGWVAKPFEVMGWKFVTSAVDESQGPTIGVDLELRETAAAVWAWSNGEETTVDPAPNTILPDWRTVGAPRSLAVSSTATVLADGTLVPSILATWLVPLDLLVTSGGRIEAEYSVVGSGVWTPVASVDGAQTRVEIVPVTVGLAYQVRVRSVNRNEAVSAWVISANVTAAGDTVAPSAPTAVSVSGVYRGIVVRWTNPTEPDLAFLEVFEQASATPAPTAGSVALARIYGSEFVRAGLNIGDTRWYWVRAVDNSGNRSAWAGGISGVAAAVGIAEITSTQIADDSISTPKLQANSITAAKVGANEIISSSANIANLAVTTLKIADQAVTIPVGAYTAAGINVNTSTWTTIQSATFPFSGTNVSIHFGLVPNVVTEDSGFFWEVQVLRGGVQIFTVILPSVSYPAGSPVGSITRTVVLPFHYSIVDTTTAASQVYQVQVRRQSSGGTVVSSDFAERTLTLIGLRK